MYGEHKGKEVIFDSREGKLTEQGGKGMKHNGEESENAKKKDHQNRRGRGKS